jgi:hypothetical protein
VTSACRRAWLVRGWCWDGGFQSRRSRSSLSGAWR